MGWTVSEVERVERSSAQAVVDDLGAGHGLLVTPQEVTALLVQYEVSPSQARQLLELARRAATPPWWQPYRAELGPRLGALLAHEMSAQAVVQYHALRVPALLQTGAYQSYVRELPSTGGIQGMVGEQVRIGRQQILFDPVRRLRFLIDESALWRFRRIDDQVYQLDRITELVEAGHIEMAVVPMDAGAHRGALVGSLTVLELPAAEPGAPPELVGCHTDAHPVAFSYDHQWVEDASVVLARVRSVSLDRKDSLRLLHHVRTRLGSGATSYTPMPH